LKRKNHNEITSITAICRFVCARNWNQWWVTCGAEDTGEGWSFGPFTQEEFIAAGGVVPPYPPKKNNQKYRFGL
jgi:hypothetical protein